MRLRFKVKTDELLPMLAVSEQSWNPGESLNKLEKWDIEEGKCWGRQDAVGSGI